MYHNFVSVIYFPHMSVLVGRGSSSLNKSPCHQQEGSLYSEAPCPERVLGLGGGVLRLQLGGSLYSEVPCQGPAQRGPMCSVGGVPAQRGPMCSVGGGSTCTARSNASWVISGGSRIFPRGGANSQKCYYFSIFCRKLHENERIWTPRGGARPWRPPLDPPMVMVTWEPLLVTSGGQDWRPGLFKLVHLSLPPVPTSGCYWRDPIYHG